MIAADAPKRAGRWQQHAINSMKSSLFPTCGTRIPPLSPCRVHVWHCPGAPRTPLDPLRAVGAVQVGAAVGAEVVAGLYVDHRVSAHGTLLSLVCRHPPNAREPPHITHSGRTVPVAAAIRPTRTPAPGSPSVCLDRRRALPPRLRGAAELKFLPTKRTFHPVHAFQVTFVGSTRTIGMKLTKDEIARARDASPMELFA